MGREGLIAAVFSNSAAEWRSRTGLPVADRLKRQPSLSSQAVTLFRELNREEIGSTARGFQIAIAQMWEILGPAEYNAIIAGYKYFREYILTGYNFRIIKDLKILNRATWELQRSFAELLQYDRHEQILTRDIPLYLANQKKNADLAPALQYVMQYLMDIKSGDPSLKQLFIALRALLYKRIFSWEEICQELEIKAAIRESYAAPAAVMERISRRIGRLRMEYKKIMNERLKGADMKKRYLKIDNAGNISMQFLEPIIRRVLARSARNGQLSDYRIQLAARQPHHLLFVFMRDFELNSLALLENRIRVRSSTDGREYQVSLPFSMFNDCIKQFDQLIRQVESYYKQYLNMRYSFEEYISDMNQHSKNPPIELLHAMAKKFNQLFDAIRFQIEVLLKDNEIMQRRCQASLNGGSSIGRGPVSVIASGMNARRGLGGCGRLRPPAPLPLEELRLVSNDHFRPKSLGTALKEILVVIYNWLYLFRYGGVAQLVEEQSVREKRLDSIGEQALRLGAALEA